MVAAVNSSSHRSGTQFASGRKALIGFAVFSLAYIAAMLLCLRQWDSADPWSRVDRFSGGYVLLSLLWFMASLRFVRFASGTHPRAPQSTTPAGREAGHELAGATFDARFFRLIAILSLFDLLAFVDYAHWRVLPALENPALQYLGLALSLAGCLWLVWTDRFLLAHFSGDLASRKIMMDGPYRFVRHPRYLALTISRVSFALAIASILAWLAFAFWMFAILRRIRLEEPHLCEIFGAEYDDYAKRTARLIPGIY
jgi:protein-S-isoprenylcysteine O-methyltransferase Ste14